MQTEARAGPEQKGRLAGAYLPEIDKQANKQSLEVCRGEERIDGRPERPGGGSSGSRGDFSGNTCVFGDCFWGAGGGRGDEGMEF